MLPLQESNGNYRGRLLQRRRAAPAPVATCGRVALPKNETIITGFGHGRSRRSLYQEDVKKKARVRDPKKELRVCPNVGRKALQISA